MSAGIDTMVSMGVNGVEFFKHPYEFGVRKAKEVLFTSGSLSARDAGRIGMINRVVVHDPVVEPAFLTSSRP
ncbi:hypothetical protein [Nonomuraea cavernae]|uniref:Uncharacterized protein n=1 Tax=Nonomuraea cavernae TaxID=2045107 RepID=A0A917YQX2_9ACTN|nr:hypothetical protein [Nonomuraea cavernae]MCA2184741.1 hypothetical protein [Nonomuraea cavernae]GGO62889.1 hypothetical protein GCM10012289_08510 [Nonomuraea cavernae]